MNILTVSHVSKTYGSHVALDDVSLEIPRGSVYGLLGPNGAGKSTLIRIINRITAADRGEVLFDGHPITTADIRHIGYLPEERGLYKKMRVGEQAIFLARLHGLTRQEATVRLRRWFERLDLLSWWDKRVEELSKGMAQKVQFISTVLHEPELLIFDEPFSGFDPINADLLKREMLALRDAGATIIFSTHNMASVEEVCDHITLINRSRNILSGAVAEIRRQYGSGLYEVRYRGDEATLAERLQGIATLTTKGEEAGEMTALLRPAEGVEMRRLIAVTNDTVELHALQEVIPSMNNIFISAVQGTL